MKKLFLCFVVSLGFSGLFAQDYSIFNRKVEYLNDILSSYNSSINSFVSIFSGNDIKILMGNIDVLNSKYRQLDIYSLSHMENKLLRLLRNAIYARYGYKFISSDLSRFFKSFDWYDPKFDNVDNRLTDIDKFHIQMIQQFENRDENIPDIVLKDMVGFWHDSAGVGSGYGERFIFHPGNKLEFYYSQMQDLKIVYSISGNYEIKGNVLIYKVTEILFNINNTDIEYSTGGGVEWIHKNTNKLIPENPIIFKFPITNTQIMRWSDGFERRVITIGGRYFFKISDELNPY